jgi:hypothetical protein
LRIADSGDLRAQGFIDRFVRLGKLEQRQRSDDRPCRVEFAGLETELRTPREAMMIVVQSFASRQPGDQAKIGGGVLEILVTDMVTQPIDL